MFPGGRPGVGLLLLRALVGLTACAEGILYLASAAGATLAERSLGLVLTASGAALAIGFLTPFAGLVVGICFLGIALSWVPAPYWALHDARWAAVGIVVTAVAIALLGPGAFSLDGRLFGRREIVIPPGPRPPEP